MGIFQLPSWEIWEMVSIEIGSSLQLNLTFTVIEDGSVTQRGQSLPCRAPEVWQGYGCRHASDVWSLGVTVSTDIRVFKRKLIFGS
jgi:hypothetical protein